MEVGDATNEPIEDVPDRNGKFLVLTQPKNVTNQLELNNRMFLIAHFDKNRVEEVVVSTFSTTKRIHAYYKKSVKRVGYLFKAWKHRMTKVSIPSLTYCYFSLPVMPFIPAIGATKVSTPQMRNLKDHNRRTYVLSKWTAYNEGLSPRDAASSSSEIEDAIAIVKDWQMNECINELGWMVETGGSCVKILSISFFSCTTYISIVSYCFTLLYYDMMLSSSHAKLSS